ncbi:hypothetical protein [Candidatus Mesenet endosymbiont of Agriotes lineatus]|uniref:hypothetical protein n=1 Tax=Candidatus Mesenet endosymbiont of Agriotes lineatus TaxID=3077948 RepID=UPI0030D1DE89
MYENLKNKFQDQAHKCVQLRKELTDCEVIVDRAVENSKKLSAKYIERSRDL